MKPLIFPLFSPNNLTEQLLKQKTLDLGEFTLRYFPDGETYLKIKSDVKNRDTIVLTTLNQANEKILSLLFLAKQLKTLGAKSIKLVTPYLGYMRQDKVFNPGEALTAKFFAEIISTSFDSMLTIDAHLHRFHSLSEIYTIPAKNLHVVSNIANYILNEIANPLLIGPDNESKQWVSEIAEAAKIPFVILNKERLSDHQVIIHLPKMDNLQTHTPVLIDDIIATAGTMITALSELKKLGVKKAYCIGVHAVFAGQAYQQLEQVGIAKVITCNTIEHKSNAIDVSDLLLKAIFS